MRTIVQTGPGVLELNWQWLPTWIGMNAILKKDLEDTLKDKIVGREITQESLDEIDTMVIDFIVTKAKGVEGVRDYLDGLKFVQEYDPRREAPSGI